jgi:hypothetical protein
MIAEALRYESGHKVFRPDQRRHGLRSTAPFGRYVSQPLSVHCKDMDELRRFLAKCKQVSDKEQFGKDDYWQAPDEFEKSRKGDCDCFALWTWRQLAEMGCESARFVTGRVGRFGAGHAWVTFEKDGKVFILDPTYAAVGPALPRLATLSYSPKFSVEWSAGKLIYYEHKPKTAALALREAIPLFMEWAKFWSWFWLRIFWKIPFVLVSRLGRMLVPLK